MIQANEPVDVDVVIIGAGLAGLAVAVGLGVHSFDVVVLERSDGFISKGSGVVVAPNGVRALEELSPGLQSILSESAQYIGECDVKSYPLTNCDNQHVISTFQRKEPDTISSILLPWWLLRDGLLSQVPDNVRLFTSSEIQAPIVESPDYVEVRTRGGLVIRAKLLIGAEGVFSVVRRHLHLSDALPSPNKISRGWVWMNQHDRAIYQEGTAVSMHQIGGQALSLVYFQKNHLCWVVYDYENEDDEEEDLMHRLRHFPSSVTSAVARTQAGAMIHTSGRNHTLPPIEVDGWGGRKRITIIGDAAHAMHLVNGQNASMAFEDALALTRELSAHRDVLGKGEKEMDELVRRFETERLKRVRVVHDDQRIRSEASKRGESPDPWSEEFKAWLFAGI